MPGRPIDESAFPQPVVQGADGKVFFAKGGGLTKREYFAGQALIGLMAVGSISPVADSLAFADEMIAALEEGR